MTVDVDVAEEVAIVVEVDVAVVMVVEVLVAVADAFAEDVAEGFAEDVVAVPSPHAMMRTVDAANIEKIIRFILSCLLDRRQTSTLQTRY